MGAADNKRAIYRGFLRLHTTMEKTASEGMRRVGKASFELLIQKHAERDPDMNHLLEENTMAYAVARDGVVFDSDKHSGRGDYDPGMALEMATSMAETASKGFVSVLTSDMINDWYDGDLEMGFLHEIRNEIRESINNYFPTTT